jgi:hypothetical protein
MSNDAPTALAESAATPVRGFEVTFLWPLRLIPDGDLKTRREDQNQVGDKWLQQYAGYIAQATHQAGGRASDSPVSWQPAEYFDRAKRGAPLGDQAGQYAEFVYFHPYIHRIFFERQSHTACLLLTRSDIRAVRVRLRHEDDAPVWRLTASDVRLFLFPPGIAIASVRLSGPPCEVSRNPAAKARPFCLADALDFLDYVRHVYPPWWAVDGSCGIPGQAPPSFEWLGADGQPIGERSDFESIGPYLDHVRDNRTVPVAAHWRSFLRPLLPDPGEDQRKSAGDCLYFAQLEDDRIPLLAWLSVDDPEKISPGDWFRLAFCDDHGDSRSYPFSGPWLERTSANVFYDRFWNPPAFNTRYACCGYAFTAVGKDSDDKFTRHVRNHMARHYYLLAVLAHLQKASLLYFWQNLSEIVQEFASAPAAKKESRQELRSNQRWLLQDLTDFVSRFYFIEVSNQLQARELFELWHRSLGIEQLYKEVRDQMEFVARVIETNYQMELVEEQTKIADQQRSLAAAANLLLPPTAAATLVAALFSIPGVPSGMASWSACVCPPIPWLASVGTGAVVFGGAWLVGRLLIRRWPVRRS